TRTPGRCTWRSCRAASCPGPAGHSALRSRSWDRGSGGAEPTCSSPAARCARGAPPARRLKAHKSEGLSASLLDFTDRMGEVKAGGDAGGNGGGGGGGSGGLIVFGVLA